MLRSKRLFSRRKQEESAPNRSIADLTGFHLAGIGASLIGAAARLRETEDFALGQAGIEDSLHDLDTIHAALVEIAEGRTSDAIRRLDDLGYYRVLRRLT